jgi:zinc protease
VHSCIASFFFLSFFRPHSTAVSLPYITHTCTLNFNSLGGSRDVPQPDFDQKLANLAASIEGGAGADYLSTGFECLKEDADEVLSLFASLVQRPALPAEKLELVRSQALNAYAHRNDNASFVPRREIFKLLYGPDSLYARNTSPEMLRAISLEDVSDFLARWERPDTAVLGIVGDFDVAEMRARVEATFGPWRAAEGQPARPPVLPASPVPTLLAPKGVDRSSIYLIDRPGSQNAIVVLGNLGVKLSDPDVYALEVLNKNLNGFGGLLFSEVRSKNGLAYSVSAASEAGIDHPGTFFVGGDTRKPAEFIRQVEGVLTRVREEGLSAEEVAAAKQQAEDEFVFNFSSTSSQLSRLVSYTSLGIDRNFLFDFNARVQKVTAEKVQEAARRSVRVREQTIVVIGDAASIRSSLEELGRPVIDLDVSVKM